jgi:hypothetical protein
MEASEAAAVQNIFPFGVFIHFLHHILVDQVDFKSHKAIMEIFDMVYAGIQDVVQKGEYPVECITEDDIHPILGITRPGDSEQLYIFLTHFEKKRVIWEWQEKNGIKSTSLPPDEEISLHNAKNIVAKFEKESEKDKDKELTVDEQELLGRALECIQFHNILAERRKEAEEKKAKDPPLLKQKIKIKGLPHKRSVDLVYV